MGLVVFTDLDGTLLDHHTYSFRPAEPALAKLKERGVPLVLCSSKTRAEMLVLWEKLMLDTPLIAENGGGVFLPEAHPLASLPGWSPAGSGWLVQRLGMDIEHLRLRLAGFADEFQARGFGQMSQIEVAKLTGLSLADAARARQREFSEPVLLPGGNENFASFSRAARQAGLGVTRGGRFVHLLGGGDKGKAVSLVRELYGRSDPELRTMALGDALNDLPMLAAVDYPVLVAGVLGGHAEMSLTGLERVQPAGPAGWNKAVLSFLDHP